MYKNFKGNVSEAIDLFFGTLFEGEDYYEKRERRKQEVAQYVAENRNVQVTIRSISPEFLEGITKAHEEKQKVLEQRVCLS